MAIDHAGRLWVIRDADVVRVNEAGEIRATIDDAGKPSAVAISPRGELVVCDAGPRRQVRVYDVSGEPKLLRTHGREGGLRAGTAGKIGPDKFYGLRGANFDAEGNLYVAMDMGFGAAGTAIVSLTPDGRERFRLNCLAFVDAFDFDPAGDGTILYSTQEIVRFDPDAPEGEHWSHEAMTVDPIRYPDDNRRSGGAQIARVDQRRLLMFHPQRGGMKLYAFEEGDSHIARPVNASSPDGGQITLRAGGATNSGLVIDSDGSGQAWYLDAEGSIWSGDTGDNVIRRWPIQRWTDDGMPVYDVQKPETWPWPEGWNRVKRVVYEPGTDTLYITGNTKAYPDLGTNLVGRVIKRYDHWTSGDQTQRYAIEELPRDLRHTDNKDKEDGLPPKSIAIAGDYIFLTMVWHSPPVREGQHGMRELSGRPLMVHVYRKDTGEYVGNMWGDWMPLPIVDMRHGMNAFKRSDGQYLITVEEVYRGKNIVYLWTPPTD